MSRSLPHADLGKSGYAEQTALLDFVPRADHSAPGAADEKRARQLRRDQLRNAGGGGAVVRRDEGDDEVSALVAQLAAKRRNRLGHGLRRARILRECRRPAHTGSMTRHRARRNAASRCGRRASFMRSTRAIARFR